MPEALAALETDAEVEVTLQGWGWIFAAQELEDAADLGLILYPGGRVDARAYAPAARAIAAQGYRVALVSMPLNLAVLAPDRALQVMATYPGVERWAIGGHSLGGAMAARFAHRHPELSAGLVLWASYPAASNDLSASDLPVVSIYGTRDGLATVEDIQASRALLPAETRWAPITGGNHAQFGWYGEQAGDNAATVTRAAQQRRVVEETLALLRALE